MIRWRRLRNEGFIAAGGKLVSPIEFAKICLAYMPDLIN